MTTVAEEHIQPDGSQVIAHMNGGTSEKRDVVLDESGLLEQQFGLPLDQLYKLSQKYYRGRSYHVVLLLSVNFLFFVFVFVFVSFFFFFFVLI